MAFGKSIRIFLKDGTVTGMKFSEVVNHTIQSISCPRLKTSDLSQLPEARRPGVYFLFGKDEETNEDMAYIGEAENVFDRLQNHLLNKGFWNEVVFFISKDENLTKAHVKYLESRIIQIAHKAKRCKIENFNQPQLSALPLADRDSMEEFLEQIKMLVGLFGHKVLEEINQFQPKLPSAPVSLEPVLNITETPSNVELFLSVSAMHAKAVQTNEGIVVLAGSDATANITESLSLGYRGFRQKLIDTGDLQFDGKKYKFQKDILFSSPSAAAAIVAGYSFNGLNGWRNSHGKTLKSIEEERLNSSKTNPVNEQNSMF